MHNNITRNRQHSACFNINPNRSLDTLSASCFSLRLDVARYAFG